MQELFKDETIRNFFADSGRQMIADLLTQADRVCIVSIHILSAVY